MKTETLYRRFRLCGFYSIAMIAMKSWWSTPGPGLAFVLLMSLAVAVLLEIFARLGIIYVGILGAEVVLIGLASFLWFGEDFSVREIVGIAFVVLGTGLAWA